MYISRSDVKHRVGGGGQREGERMVDGWRSLSEKNHDNFIGEESGE